MPVNKNICDKCGEVLEIDFRAFRITCPGCIKRRKRNESYIKLVRVISFFCFPIGFLIYFIWKDTNPKLAKQALIFAAISISFIIFMQYLLTNY